MRIKLLTQRFDNPYIIAYDKIIKKYGHGCTPSDVFDAGDKWKISIESYIPKHIIDEKTQREKMLIYHYRNLGNIFIDKDTLHVLELPSIKNFNENLIDRKSLIRNSVEQDLVKVIGDPRLKIKFGKMKFALFGMQPIYRTIINILNEQHPEISELRKINYLDLVELINKSGYAEFVNNKLKGTEKLNELLKICNYSDVETAEAILGIMLSNYYEYLSKTLHIIHFIPYIKVGTSYYSSAVEFGDLIRMSLDSLRIKVKEYYRKNPTLNLKKSFGFNTLVTEMVAAGVFTYEENYLKGQSEILNKLIYIRNQLPIKEDTYSYMV